MRPGYQLAAGLVGVEPAVEAFLALLLRNYALDLVVLLALLLWLGWLWAAPPPPFLGVLRPVAFGVGVIRHTLFFSLDCTVSGETHMSAQWRSATPPPNRRPEHSG